jgi:hypothetical protein
MTGIRHCAPFVGVLVLILTAHAAAFAADAPAAAPAAVDLSIGTPDSQPTIVDASGDLHEDWGVIGLRLIEPEGGAPAARQAETSRVPTVVTTASAGSIILTTTAYRAPIWPAGVDVVTARLANDGASEQQVRFQVTLPEQAQVGERVAVLGGRAILALPKEPQPVRRERSWGALGGDVPMPGWGRPDRDCDPAFRNIRAGMGGVPVIYRFAVPPGAKRTVVLGLCESHYSQAGLRPVLLYVEGAPRVEIDPLAAWGRHVPGCLTFDAFDANGDGRLQIVAAPHPGAPDRNPILNAIWVFSPDVYVDVNEVASGKLSSVAEYYVDVGGEKDQSLYEGGNLTYELTLPAGDKREIVFLVAGPGASVPNPEPTAWTAASLRQAADDVWSDWAAREARARKAITEP